MGAADQGGAPKGPRLPTLERRSMEIELLLKELSGSLDLRPFYEAIKPLETYDRERRGDLLRTLRVLFNANGNVSEAAELLYLHRNSLIYRLERVQELTGLNLKDPQARLVLQLGLLAHDADKGENIDTAEHPQPACRDDNGSSQGRPDG